MQNFYANFLDTLKGKFHWSKPLKELRRKWNPNLCFLELTNPKYANSCFYFLIFYFFYLIQNCVSRICTEYFFIRFILHFFLFSVFLLISVFFYWLQPTIQIIHRIHKSTEYSLLRFATNVRLNFTAVKLLCVRVIESCFLVQLYLNPLVPHNNSMNSRV